MSVHSVSNFVKEDDEVKFDDEGLTKETKYIFQLGDVVTWMPLKKAIELYTQMDEMFGDGILVQQVLNASEDEADHSDEPVEIFPGRTSM